MFVGIDVIGDYLTEINVTSPTGIRAVKNVGGPDIAKMVWDVIEAKRKAERGAAIEARARASHRGDASLRGNGDERPPACLGAQIARLSASRSG